MGLSGYFERVIRLIPASIASGLLAGILLQFGLDAFAGLRIEPKLVGVLVLSYLVFKRINARYAVIGLLCVGIGFLWWQNRLDLTSLRLELGFPIWNTPIFSLNALKR